MKKFKKTPKFYLGLLIFSSTLILIYSLFQIIRNDTPISELYTTWFLPVFFVGVYWGSDLLLDKIFNRKKRVDYEAKFLDAIGQRMRESNLFTIEDFRRLQINMKFQQSLDAAYKIYQNGEDDLFNIDKLEKKFNKESKEYLAMKFVIDYLEENKDKNGNHDKNKV
jgi:hypothetical protein